MCLIPWKDSDGRTLTDNERMVLYYKKAGLPNEVVQYVGRYERNEVTKEQLARYMHLTPALVTEVKGAGWELATMSKHNLQADGVSVTMPQMKELLQGEADFIASMSDEMYAEYIQVAEFLAENNYSPAQINQWVYEVMTGDPELVGEYNSVVADAAVVTLSGSASHDYILGNALDNQIYGNEGNDIIIGGLGNDYLHGGQGSDTYIWRVGDGNDVINDVAIGSDANVLFFGDGVRPEDITFTRDGYNGIFTHAESGATITVENWFSHYGCQLSEVKFIDGTVWTTEDVNAKLSAPNSAPVIENISSKNIDRLNAGIALAKLQFETSVNPEQVGAVVLPAYSHDSAQSISFASSEGDYYTGKTTLKTA